MRVKAKKQAGGYDSKHEKKYEKYVLEQWKAAGRIAYMHHPDPFIYGVKDFADRIMAERIEDPQDGTEVNWNQAIERARDLLCPDAQNIRHRKYTFDYVVRWFDAEIVHRQAWLEVKGFATDYDRLRIEYFSECKPHLEVYFVELRGGRWTYRQVRNGKMDLGVTSRSTQETKNRLATPPWER